MKFIVDDVKDLKAEDIKHYDVADIVVTSNQGMNKAYIVSLKADTKAILTYIGDDEIETVVYEKKLVSWKYISTKIAKLKYIEEEEQND